MRITILLVISVTLVFTAKAQKPFVRDYWLNEAATPVRVNAMAQDTIGYIWLGTDAGLICFDGANMITVADSIHQPVTAVTTSQGRVWAGYANGTIGMVSGLQVETVAIRNGPKAPVTGMYADAMLNMLLITTESGVYAAVNNVAVRMDETNGLSDNFTYGVCISQGHIFIGSDKGVNDINISSRARVTSITSRQGLPDNIVRVIKSAGAHKYWIGTQEGGVTIYDRDTQKVWPAKPPGLWIWGQVNDILPVSDTRAWVATETGYLLEVTQTDSATLDIHPYLYQDRLFRKLLLDPAGNIWCATNKGLTLMTGEYMAAIKLEAPYLLHDATAMTIVNDTLLVALNNKLFELPVKAPVPTLTPVFTSKVAITSLFVDKDHRLWIGTWGDGVFYKERGGTVTSVNTIPALLKGSIINIAGTNEDLWISGLNGVEQVSYPVNRTMTLVKHHSKRSGIGSDYVYQLYPDRKGNVWMATDGAGVCMYDGAKYHHWTSFSANTSKVAYSITEDISGDMWAGLLYKDIYHFHNNNWENLRRHETQNVDINISSVMANATGQVISVSQRCIDEWYPRSRYFRHFNSALRVGIDSTSSVLNCVTKDEKGNVYVPYQHGILMFRDQNGGYDIRPHVHIMHANLFLNQIGLSRHRFAYDENYLSFFFGGINFSNPERANYRYKLEGYNPDWVTTKDGSVTYARLPPGKYTFRIQTSLNSNYDHAQEDSYSFIIGQPFWRTALFYIAVILVCIGLVYLYIKIREKRLNKMMQLEQERMRFEYEHLKSQINPHFLFNSLNTLTSLIEEDKDNAVTYTAHLSDLYRYILAYPDKDLILLAEECEILNNYIHIQKSRFGEALNVEIRIPDRILNTRKIIPLALQMLVENAIKHNVVSASQPLYISVTANEDEITVSNVINPKISKEKRSGLGLVNIVKRYGLLTDRKVIYGISDNNYIVTLPLL